MLVALRFPSEAGGAGSKAAATCRNGPGSATEVVGRLTDAREVADGLEKVQPRSPLPLSGSMRPQKKTPAMNSREQLDHYRRNKNGGEAFRPAFAALLGKPRLSW